MSKNILPYLQKFLTSVNVSKANIHRPLDMDTIKNTLSQVNIQRTVTEKSNRTVMISPTKLISKFHEINLHDNLWLQDSILSIVPYCF